MKPANEYLAHVSDAELMAELSERLKRTEPVPFAHGDYLPVEVPPWLTDGSHRNWSNEFRGDAGKAQSEFFQWWYVRDDKQFRIMVFCPTFIRGPLSFHSELINGSFTGGASY